MLPAEVLCAVSSNTGGHAGPRSVVWAALVTSTSRWPRENHDTFSTPAVIWAGWRWSRGVESKARACGWRREVWCVYSSVFESRRKTRCPDFRRERVRPRPIPLAALVMSQLRDLVEGVAAVESSSPSSILQMHH